MRVEDGKVYRLRDGRKATAYDDSDSQLSKLRGEASFYGYVFRNTGRANHPSGPDVDYDIVGLWDDKNPDGTYKLPDHTIAMCWRHDSGELICRSRASNTWNGPFHLAVDPPEGRWLPLTEPTFPERKKCAVRICEATTHDGKRQMLAWVQDRPWEFVSKSEGYNCNHVSDIRWLTPEYEDEMGGGTWTTVQGVRQEA